MADFVLIPGAWHGGWCFAPVAERLREHGHDVHPLTLTGLSERRHLLHAGVNLDTHVQDVLGYLASEQLEDVVLVGHSYGGMVISAVADRTPDRVKALVYLDALVPQDGDSAWRIANDEQRTWFLDVDESGYGVRPLPFLDPRATPHPMATLFQPVRLSTDLSRFHREYVFARQWPTVSPFVDTYQKLANDPQWTVYALDSAHNLMRDAPDELLAILLNSSRAKHAT
jgi:pimeloyl-ACP methyl ester carboxylesterase